MAKKKVTPPSTDGIEFKPYSSVYSRSDLLMFWDGKKSIPGYAYKYLRDFNAHHIKALEGDVFYSDVHDVVLDSVESISIMDGKELKPVNAV